MVTEQQIEAFKYMVSENLKTALRNRAPVDEGRLKASIEVSVVGDELVIEMVDYALYVEFGTPPHIIRPKNKQALHWKSGGKDVFAKMVHHPGTRPNPFIRTTFKQDLMDIISNNIYLLGEDAEVTVEV